MDSSTPRITAENCSASVGSNDALDPTVPDRTFDRVVVPLLPGIPGFQASLAPREFEGAEIVVRFAVGSTNHKRIKLAVEWSTGYLCHDAPAKLDRRELKALSHRLMPIAGQ